MQSDEVVRSREEKESGRVEAFSDGVFAIAITLLVLELKVPHAEELQPIGGLLTALVQQWPSYFAFVLSFVAILIMWVNHHVLFSHIRRVDGAFLFLNGLLLFFVTLIPFTTALLAAYIQQADAQIATIIYSGTYLGVALAFNQLWRYASHEHRLLSQDADRIMINRINRQYSWGPPLYLFTFVLAFINASASITVCSALAVFFAFTGSLGRLFD